MLTVYYQNKSGLILRPTPLVTITQAANRNEVSSLGSTYNIVLSGTIIVNQGSPVASSSSGSPDVDSDMKSLGINWTEGSGAARNPSESTEYGEKLGTIINKQTVIRELFAMDGQKMELSSISNDSAKLIFYPTVDSIDFEQGSWVDICRYTVTLTASSLMKSNGELVMDSRPMLTSSLKEMNTSIGEDGGLPGENYQNGDSMTELGIIEEYGGFVSSFQDSWTLEPDEGLSTSDEDGRPIRMGYRLSRTMSAQGITKYIADFSNGGDTGKPKKYDAWVMARGFIHKSILKDDGTDGAEGSEDYPLYEAMDTYASGFIDLENYTGYNNSRTESLDPATGEYTIQDSWTIASGLIPAYEVFNINLETNTGTAYAVVTIAGTITGASSTSAAEQTRPEKTGEARYDRALLKYYNITNSGQFGINSTVYKRANGTCEQLLNSQPASVSLSTNEFTGEITYSLTFDNRPTNIFTGVMSESIAVSDNSPGDVYAAIPVLGRTTGPVLQYMDMRTEYTRNVSIEIQLDYTDIGYGNNRENLLMTKPSLNAPIKNELDQVIKELSPANEPGIVKYFINSPSESWSPRDGRYSLSISWTYELDR